MKTKRFETRVVGMQHRVTMSTRRMMAASIKATGRMPVMLIREHDNKHDENAIKVVVRNTPYKGLHVGYLPRPVASVYAHALDEQEIQVGECEMFDVSPDDGEASVILRFTRRSAAKPKTATKRVVKKGSTKRVTKKSRKGA